PSPSVAMITSPGARSPMVPIAAIGMVTKPGSATMPSPGGMTWTLGSIVGASPSVAEQPTRPTTPTADNQAARTCINPPRAMDLHQGTMAVRSPDRHTEGTAELLRRSNQLDGHADDEPQVQEIDHEVRGDRRAQAPRGLRQDAEPDAEQQRRG